MVAPSIAENLPNNLLEAFGCGLPAVGFDTGGMKDAIRHEETGYLAKHADAEDFSHGIKLLLNNDKLRGILAANARKLAELEYDQKLEASRFEELYSSLVFSHPFLSTSI
jgi:glycosyltransferase involved in cell wall biosynthesis